MDYMDLTVGRPRKAVKVYHSLNPRYYCIFLHKWFLKYTHCWVVKHHHFFQKEHACEGIIRDHFVYAPSQ